MVQVPRHETEGGSGTGKGATLQVARTPLSTAQALTFPTPHPTLPVARQVVLDSAAQSSNTQLRSIVQHLPTSEEPPTHYITNKFTSCFQTIVEAYGVARYREVRVLVWKRGWGRRLLRLWRVLRLC
jgi:hypothetical protein